MNLFNLSVSSAELSFSFSNEEKRRKKRLPLRYLTTHTKSKPTPSTDLLLYQATEDIRGTLTVQVTSANALEHTGLHVDLLGFIELAVNRRPRLEFVTSHKELQPSGAVIRGEETFDFVFPNIEKYEESYYGHSVKLRYVLRATLARGNYASSLVHEQDLWIQRVVPTPSMDHLIKMEVGIDECLHLEFEYNKSNYHLEDVVIGKICFLLVRIKIKHMELAIVRRESVGSSTQRHSESDTLTKFEIMDGAPVKGESVPVRLYLAPYELTPTYRNVQNRFSVKYYLNLVLVDDEDRRYFKQQEITLWRKNVG